jgi:predicted NodU family carbamoyl transferase
MLVNTSLNLHRPIVVSPNQALDMLEASSGLDALVLVADDGWSIVARRRGSVAA